MAHLLGAKQVEAFDIDSWCVDNGNENFDLNGVTTRMGLGTIREVQPQGPYELILANINKNVLLDELAIYSGLLPSQGLLLLSGFYSEDIQDLVQAASAQGLSLTMQTTKDNWAALCLQKK
jgi:ribosomal protein L11 methyltransferase